MPPPIAYVDMAIVIAGVTCALAVVILAIDEACKWIGRIR